MTNLEHQYGHAKEGQYHRIIRYLLNKCLLFLWSVLVANRPYRLFTFDPMASFSCLPVLARQACAWRLHLMFPARICCFLILSPITNLSLNVLCTKHEDWCHTKTRLLGQKWINGKVYCLTWRHLAFFCIRWYITKTEKALFCSFSLLSLMPEKLIKFITRKYPRNQSIIPVRLFIM